MAELCRALLLLFVAQCSADCEDYTNPTTRIESEGPVLGAAGCITVSGGFFEGLSAWQGGAIMVKWRLSLTITDCSFIRCDAVRQVILPSYGGACNIGATSQTMQRCCGTSCKSDDYGHFVFIVGTFHDSSVPMESRTFSEIAVLSCGNGGAGSVLLEAPVSAQFFQFNITSCQSSVGGGAFCADGLITSAFYRFRYLNVFNCSNSKSIIWNQGSSLPEIEYTNFYDNKPTDINGGTPTLLMGKGMKIRNGVFRGNTETFVSSDANPAFDFDFCYFSPSAPLSGATTGSNCAVTVTASLWIFAINTAACPGIPTLSPSPSISKSPTASTPVATPTSGFAPSAAVARSSGLPISHGVVNSINLPVSCSFLASAVFNISARWGISSVFDQSESPADTTGIGGSPGLLVTVQALKSSTFVGSAAFNGSMAFDAPEKFGESAPLGPSAVLSPTAPGDVSYIYGATVGLDFSLLMDSDWFDTTVIHSRAFDATGSFTSSDGLLDSMLSSLTIGFSSGAVGGADGWLSAGAIAGMASGAAALVGLIVWLLMLIRRRSVVDESYTPGEMGEQPHSLQLADEFSHEFGNPLTVLDQTALQTGALWTDIQCPDERI
jgi:hypothetical protein